MQSLYGKLRLVTKQTLNNLKNLESRTIAAVDAEYLGCSIQSSGFISQHSSLGSGFLLVLFHFCFFWPVI